MVEYPGLRRHRRVENVGEDGLSCPLSPGVHSCIPMAVFDSAGRSTQRRQQNMKLQKLRSLRHFAAAAAALLVLAGSAIAGPPLICPAIDIGSADSLPWPRSGWNLSGQENYDVSHLVPDTLALLAPSTPVLVRMETLRRAT